MKACLDCDSPAPNEQTICEICGRATAWRIISDEEAAALGYGAREGGEGFPLASLPPRFGGERSRPDGSLSMLLGGIAIGLGFLLLLFALGADEIGTFWNLLLFGGGLAQLGLVFWLAGYIVKAISFIPGKGE